MSTQRHPEDSSRVEITRDDYDKPVIDGRSLNPDEAAKAGITWVTTGNGGIIGGAPVVRHMSGSVTPSTPSSRGLRNLPQGKQPETK